MHAILALDQGTTSSRAIVFDHIGQILSRAQEEFPQLFPKPAWVEHEPMAIWQTQLRVAQTAVSTATQKGAEIAAIGITNQRETVLLWDRATGMPLANAIVWQDRRTAAACQLIRAAGHEADIQHKTGLVLDAYFSATKIRWLLDNIPHARERAQRGEVASGTIDSWLIWNLTQGKVHATDVSNASRTMLFNLHTLDWDDDLLALFDIPRAMLPKIVSSSAVIGETCCDGLPAGIPIAGVAGDQQAALFGQTCTTPGMVKNTYGTGCFMLMNTGTQRPVSQHRLLTTVAWRLGEDNAPTHYCLEGSVFTAGAAVQWLRDGVGIIEHASEMEALATSVPDSDGVMVVPAFAGLGAPYWDPNARGTILGLTRGSTRAHIARATLEAIAFQSAELMQAMRHDTDLAVLQLRVDGGVAANNFLMQFQADLLGIDVVRPRVLESTALGAAALAALALGEWPDFQSAAAHVERRFQPNMTRDEAETRMGLWKRATTRALDWAS